MTETAHGATDPTPSARSAPASSPLVNDEVEVAAKANCFVSRLDPKAGTIVVGDGGMDFVVGIGRGFVSIPWANVDKVRADVYGRHVRGIEVVTDEGMVIPFVVSHGYDVLRAIHAHIGRERIFSSRSRVRGRGSSHA